MQSTLYLESNNQRNGNETRCISNGSSILSKYPNHWSNIPSGAEYQRNLESKYPGMKSGKHKSDYDPSFPYSKLRPAPQKPASNLLHYSNTNIYSNQNSQIDASKYNNSYLFIQNHPNNVSRGFHEDDRIRKALKHIDSA